MMYLVYVYRNAMGTARTNTSRRTYRAGFTRSTPPVRVLIRTRPAELQKFEPELYKADSILIDKDLSPKPFASSLLNI